MKKNNEIIRRIEKLEKKLETFEEEKYVVRDFGGYYFGDCGFELSKKQFEAWLTLVKKQEQGAKVIVLEYTSDGQKFLGTTTLNNPQDRLTDLVLETEHKSGKEVQ